MGARTPAPSAYDVSVMGDAGEMAELLIDDTASCGCRGTWYLRWWANLVRWDLLVMEHEPRCQTASERGRNPGNAKEGNH